MKLTEALARVAIVVGRAMGRARRAIQHRLTGRPPAAIIAYAGYGTPATVRLSARVIDDADIGEPSPQDTSWRNARRMFRVFDAQRVEGARVRVEYAGQSCVVETDARGFARAEFAAPATAPFARGATTSRWVLERPAPAPLKPAPLTPATAPVTQTAPVYIPLEAARFIVVSDVDDTIMHSSATSAVRLVIETLRHNVYRRVAFPGVGAFYRALTHAPEFDAPAHHAAARPIGQHAIYYLTSSVWRVHGLLAAFFALHGLPAGPLLMSDRRLVHGSFEPDRHRLHKLAHLRALVALHPEHRLVLIGDCGQRDPEIFAELAASDPARVAAIYLRDLGDARRLLRVEALLAPARAAGVPICIAPDSLSHARHAVEHGFIDPARLDAIHRSLPEEAQATEPATTAEAHGERPPEAGALDVGPVAD